MMTIGIKQEMLALKYNHAADKLTSKQAAELQGGSGLLDSSFSCIYLK